jgi:hypothetical protein
MRTPPPTRATAFRLAWPVLLFLAPAPRGAAQEAAPRTATLEDLARLVEGQRALLEAQGRRIEALEKRLAETGELALSATNRLNELGHEPAAATVPAAVEARQQVADRTVQLTPELDVKDISEEFPRAFKIPGTDAALRIGGQVKTVIVHNIGAVGTDDRFVTSSIPVEGSADADKGSRTTYTVDPSRLNFDMRTPSGVGHLRAFVEADFAGSGRTFRLRHAYGQWKRFLFGQTWSTFSDPEAEPDGIDFEGLNAISLFRQPQVRWTRSLGEHVSMALSIENPNPDITGAAGVNQVPDLIGRVRWEPGGQGLSPLGLLRRGSHVQAAVLVRQVRGAGPDRPNDPVGTTGIGVNVSGRLRVPGKAARDYVTFATNLGDGIGRYITDLGTLGGQDAVFDPSTNTLEALPVGSAYVGYQHWWTETIRTTVTWGSVWVDNLDIQTPDSLHKTQRASLNLSWSPISRIDLVGELLWGRRVNKDRGEGKATQYQFGGVFRF